MRIRTLSDQGRVWAEGLVCKHFGSARVVSRGVLHETRRLPGLVAEEKNIPIGLLQYRIDNGQCEVFILISVRRREGIGTALLQKLRSIAEVSRCRRIWFISTNNNRIGEAFYNAVGLRKCAVYPDAVIESRELKPELPEYDEDGVAIKDEIEYEWLLNETGSSPTKLEKNHETDL